MVSSTDFVRFIRVKLGLNILLEKYSTIVPMGNIFEFLYAEAQFLNVCTKLCGNDPKLCGTHQNSAFHACYKSVYPLLNTCNEFNNVYANINTGMNQWTHYCTHAMSSIMHFYIQWVENVLASHHFLNTRKSCPLFSQQGKKGCYLQKL